MKTYPHYPIAVLGAGPGGATASLVLSKANVRHAVLDKAVFPRDKICGDAFSGKVVDLLHQLKIDIRNDVTQLPSWGVTFVAPNGKALRVPFAPGLSVEGEAPGFLSTRLEFDARLVDRVRASATADLLEATEARTFERMNGRWTIGDRSGSVILTADLIIAADGAQSAFARSVAGHTMEPTHHAAGIRCYYEGVTGLDNENFIELHFLEEFVPGYLWIFPLPDGKANVGIGLRSDLVRKRKLDLKKMLPELIERHPSLKARFSSARPMENVRGFGLPFGSKKRSLSGEGYLLVGDAGSLIDPFTGEGIGNAMISGRIAAETAIRHLANPEFALTEHDVGVYRHLWKELQLSHRLQRLASRRWLFNLLINKAVSNEALRQMISNMFMDLDVRDQLKDPRFYFKLLVQ